MKLTLSWNHAIIPIASSARPGASRKCLWAPKTTQERCWSIFRQLSIDFLSIFAWFSYDFRAASSASSLLARWSRLTEKKQKNTHRFHGRLAFGHSGLYSRLSQSTPQLASQCFTRSIKQPPPSTIIHMYYHICNSCTILSFYLARLVEIKKIETALDQSRNYISARPIQDQRPD